MGRRDPRPESVGSSFQIRERRDPDGTLILGLHGDLDVRTAPALAERIATALATVPKLVLDFNALDFMDSSGLAVLLAATKQARTHDCVPSLVRPQDGLLRLFRVAGVEALLPLEPGDPGEGGSSPHASA